MSVRVQFSVLVVGAVCCGFLQAAIVNAQDVSPSRAGWRTNVELGTVWHAGGAVEPEQPAHDLARTGFSAGLGIGRFAANGAGLRLAVRGFDERDAGPKMCTAAFALVSGGGPFTCPPSFQESNGSFAVLGVSLDLATGLSPTRIPIGIETGPDIFRTLARPHANQFGVPAAATLAGWHTTALIGIGRHSPLELTAGANWLSGGIVTWTFPVGLRFAF